LLWRPYFKYDKRMANRTHLIQQFVTALEKDL
jgi:hypothetical protein